jgi:hypothetical protein
VAGSCVRGDGPLGSGATDLVSLFCCTVVIRCKERQAVGM